MANYETVEEVVKSKTYGLVSLDDMKNIQKNEISNRFDFLHFGEPHNKNVYLIEIYKWPGETNHLLLNLKIHKKLEKKKNTLQNIPR